MASSSCFSNCIKLKHLSWSRILSAFFVSLLSLSSIVFLYICIFFVFCFWFLFLFCEEFFLEFFEFFVFFLFSPSKTSF